MFIQNRNKNINLTYFNYDYSKIEEYLSNMILSSYTDKKKINLITSYYKSPNIDRNTEINLSVKLNLKNKLFNKIILIDDTTDFVNPNDNQNSN
jgi:hypothetical protein